MTLRILTPEKKGIARRITQAVEAAGGRVEQNRVRRELRGMTETELVISFVQESMRQAIVASLGSVSGIVLLGSPERGGSSPVFPDG